MDSESPCRIGDKLNNNLVEARFFLYAFSGVYITQDFYRTVKSNQFAASECLQNYRIHFKLIHKTVLT